MLLTRCLLRYSGASVACGEDSGIGFQPVDREFLGSDTDRIAKGPLRDTEVKLPRSPEHQKRIVVEQCRDNKWCAQLMVLGLVWWGGGLTWPIAMGEEPESRTPAVNYGRPFEPPTRPAFIPLPPGTIEPTGWLRDWALTARDGYTGHMDEVDVAFRQAWAADYCMTGDQLSYWDRGAWPYEGGGYWFDGMIRLGLLPAR